MPLIILKCENRLENVRRICKLCAQNSDNPIIIITVITTTTTTTTTTITMYYLKCTDIELCFCKDSAWVL